MEARLHGGEHGRASWWHTDGMRWSGRRCHVYGHLALDIL